MEYLWTLGVWSIWLELDCLFAQSIVCQILFHSSFIKFAHDTLKQSFNNGAPRNYSSSPLRVVFRCSIVIDRHALLICEPVILPFDSKSTRKYLKQNIADVLKAKLLTLERPETDN